MTATRFPSPASVDHLSLKAILFDPLEQLMLAGRDDDERQTIPTSRHQLPSIASLVMLLLCALGIIAVVRHGLSDVDDGSGMVPIVALGGVAVAALRWRPDSHVTPSRSVSPQLAFVVTAAAAGLVGWLVASAAPGSTMGPILTLALVGTYLALWGFRRLALLRTVSLLSVLTWQPVAEFTHSVVRSTLEGPSELVYRRLAQIPVFGVDDEPWRLFSASLHRGGLVVIATIVLCVGANRWRLSSRTMFDLLMTVTGALVTHHIVLLAMPIDDYQPTDATQLATDPAIEIAIAVVAVLVLSAIRIQRERRHRLPIERAADLTSKPVGDDQRDPVIFASVRSKSQPIVTALLLTSAIPLVTLSLQG